MIPWRVWRACCHLLAFSTAASFCLAAETAAVPNANRLTYLDENDPFYPHRDFPRLTTPQWVGEPEVEAVVILAIDDMRDTPRYEAFLRPVLERLKQIDGRAPVSIMANAVNPTNAQLTAWLKEGVSIDVHTLAHPCPLLAKGNFEAAAQTYHGGLDLLARIPGNHPVAFRMPCCDSMNSPSPRFYSEIFNRVSAEGRFLTIDSSVMNIPTSRDASLPRELVLEGGNRERFRKYLPAQTNATVRLSMESFMTTIEDYPYPYVIGKLCWEFPAMVPSDWEAQNLHGSTNATTLADWKAALDVAVSKQGVFNFIFHPHGWSSSAQFVEFIDYAVSRHGRKVKFLTFHEAQERLDRHLLAGNPLRASDGGDNGVRLLDLDADGHLDVVIGNDRTRITRRWDPKPRAWIDHPFPTLTDGLQFGVVSPAGTVVALRSVESAGNVERGSWVFEKDRWVEQKSLLAGLNLQEGKPVFTARDGRDRGARFRDADGDGRCELVVGNESDNAVFAWSEAERTWRKLDYELPAATAIVDVEGKDAGLRFIDVNQDGYADVLFSTPDRVSLHLFISKANPRLQWRVGWNDAVWAGKREGLSVNVPPIARAGTNRNNGVWFRAGTMWVQNEDTAHLPDKVDRRTFHQLLTADHPAPLSPDEAVASMRVRPGFQIELAASEPLVADPIAFEWGEDGRLWVAEMGDYPLGPNGDGKPGGRIKVLEDRDGDGRYDHADEFLSQVNFPTGVMPWRKGVLVSAAPEIFYAEDTDGDGRADKRETLFVGFEEGNQQHRLNGFEYGLDNWIYGANGDSGGTIQSRRLPSLKAVSISGRDFRFRPDSGHFEAAAGQTQFGRRRDDWGNWFGNANYAWLWHYAMPEHYLARNPHVALKSSREMLANYPDSGRLFPASRTRQRFNDHHHFNHVTSGCSPSPYRDELFGEAFQGSVFISDPVHNVVHREVLEADGLTFKSHRAADEQGIEFVASPDAWFRPTMLKTGPDGALYIADMYRHVIEHPEWIPAWVKGRLDLRAGADRGRIYRVFPQGAKLRRTPRLDKLSGRELAAALDSANGWQRDTVQRLLVGAAEKSVVPALEKLAAEGSRPQARLQALATLEGLNSITPAIVLRGLRDDNAAVREHAVRVAESIATVICSGEGEAVRTELAGLRNDPSIRVRQQLALTLGQPGWSGPMPAETLVALASRDFSVPLFQAAVLSSAPPHLVGMLEAVSHRADDALPPDGLIGQLAGLAAAMKQEDALVRMLGEIERTPSDRDAVKFATLGAVLDAPMFKASTFERVVATAPGGLGPALRRFEPQLEKAAAVAGDTSRSDRDRLSAITLLGRTKARFGEDIQLLSGLLAPAHSTALHEAVIQALVRMNQPAAGRALLKGWRSYSPQLRDSVMKAALSRPEWTRLVLEEVRAERVGPRELSASWQERLLRHSDAGIREEAARLLTSASSDRQAVVKEFARAESLTGDAARGRALFQKNCATCHRLRGEGSDVGPDLSGLGSKPPAALLAAILDPNQTVEPRYASYSATLKDGRELGGLIVAETANNVTFRNAGAADETVLRSEIEEMRSSGLSLMPEGLEKGMTPQDMADLLAALR